MLLNNPRHLGQTVRQLLKRGRYGDGGWLGRLDGTISGSALQGHSRDRRAAETGQRARARTAPGSFARTMTGVLQFARSDRRIVVL